MLRSKVYYSTAGFIVLLLCAISVAEHESQSAICPKMCTCDTIEGLKRADCSHENLIHTYTDVPIGVEILDLSINKISNIDDDSFEAYINLVKLFLSENSIEFIALNAFSTLHNLESLDLSHNRLQMLHENLFEQNEKLTDLNLSNNNFINLQSRPFLSSSSIMYLDLSFCKIPQLYDSVFAQLKNLRTLDLTGNLMITLEKEPFIKLKKMRSLALHKNQWQCDSTSVRATINWMKRRINTINVENCFLNPYTKKPMFEKMELDPSARGSMNRKDVPIEQVWPSSPSQKNMSSWKDQICSSNQIENQEQCEFVINLYQAYVAQQSTNHQMASLFRDKMSLVLILSGILIGAVFGSFITYSLVYLYQKCRGTQKVKGPSQKNIREMRREFRDRNRFEHTRLNESPDPTGNRQTISHLSSQEQSQIYRNHEHTRQFLVDLFSKRQPRYVRSNSQIANLNNRHIPPSPIRNEIRTPQSASPAAASSSSFEWQSNRQNQDNLERERMLQNGPVSREPSSMSVWNDLYGIDEVRRSVTGTPSTNINELFSSAHLDGAQMMVKENGATRETPPPPYADCTVIVSQHK